MIPLQIRVLRKQREWSQAQLAQESKLTQGVISRAEDPEYGNLTVNTLVKIGAGFDCAFVGRFVPFSELGRWYTNIENERVLEVDSFNADQGFVERKAPVMTMTSASMTPSVPYYLGMTHAELNAYAGITFSSAAISPDLSKLTESNVIGIGVYSRKPTDVDKRYYVEPQRA
jgi:transcriptional regulator with XRE-family HTH domain